MKSKIINYAILIAAVFGAIFVIHWTHQWIQESRILKKVVERLSADSRVAEVLVTKSEFDEVSKKIKTTIKFLEFGAQGQPLTPKYFTFQGNIIQFQALVVRFEDRFVKAGDRLKGKSAYLFTKAFVLDGKNTQAFTITEYESIPEGYKIPGIQSEYEAQLWKEFWTYAMDSKKSAQAGIKNVQLEAPGSLFVPGTIYTLYIEHDGGLRIDAKPVPEILKGEKV